VQRTALGWSAADLGDEGKATLVDRKSTVGRAPHCEGVAESSTIAASDRHTSAQSPEAGRSVRFALRSLGSSGCLLCSLLPVATVGLSLT
jgi:hypothetical protein